MGFSFKAVLVKAAYRYGVDAETLLALRMLYSLPLFLLLGLAAARGAAEPISATDWRALALLGVLGYYGASYLDFLGLRHISAALERLILFVYPTLVVAMSAVLFKTNGSPDVDFGVGGMSVEIGRAHV